MADDTREIKPEGINEALGDIKLEERFASPQNRHNLSTAVQSTLLRTTTTDSVKKSRSTTPELQPLESTFSVKSPSPNSPSQTKMRIGSQSQTPKSEYDEENLGGDITVTVEPGKMPKLSRKQSQKVISRPATLFDDLPDVTSEATEIFQVIKDCIYGAKHMGSSEHDALDCDCSEEWSMIPSSFHRSGLLTEF